LLAKFKWGHAFYDVNRDILDMYAACDTADDVSAAEKRHLEELQRSDAEVRLRGEFGDIAVMCLLTLGL